MAQGMQRKTAARLLAVQGLYQRMESGVIPDLEAQIEALLRLYKENEKNVKPNRKLLKELLEGTIEHTGKINEIMTRFIHEKHASSRMLPLQKALLQAAAYELAMLLTTPARVILDEYVSIAHAFLSEEETGFVNGVLDCMARELREKEFS